jgi:hypothetical protein
VIQLTVIDVVVLVSFLLVLLAASILNRKFDLSREEVRINPQRKRGKTSYEKDYS